MARSIRRRWRGYRTSGGREPVQEFVRSLSDIDAAAVLDAMREVRELGLVAARHVRGALYEVRADGDKQAFRILFAAVGRRRQVLLALAGFSKKSRGTPTAEIRLAEARLRDWIERGTE